MPEAVAGRVRAAPRRSDFLLFTQPLSLVKEPRDEGLTIGGFQSDVDFVLYAFDAWVRANNIVNLKVDAT